MISRNTKKKNTLLYIFIVNWFIIAILIGGVIYTILKNKNDVVLSSESFKQAEEYENLLKQRDELIKTSYNYDSKNSQIFNSLQLTDEMSYEQKYNSYLEYYSNNSELLNILEQIIAKDKEILTLDLPANVRTNSDNNLNDDQKIYNDILNSSIYIEAQKDYLELRMYNQLFNDCANKIDLSKSEYEIYQYLNGCLDNGLKAKNKTLEIENKYIVKLNNINNLINDEYSRWESLALFYKAVSEENFYDEKKYDEIYLNKTESIKNMLSTEIWVEYKTLIMDNPELKLQT